MGMATNLAWGQIGRLQVGHWGNLGVGTNWPWGQVEHRDKLGMDANWSWGQVGLGCKLGMGTNWTATSWAWVQIGRRQIGHGANWSAAN